MLEGCNSEKYQLWRTIGKVELKTDASGAAVLLGVRNGSGVPALRGDEASIIMRVDLFVGVSKGALSNFLFTVERGVDIPPILLKSAPVLPDS